MEYEKKTENVIMDFLQKQWKEGKCEGDFEWEKWTTAKLESPHQRDFRFDCHFGQHQVADSRKLLQGSLLTGDFVLLPIALQTVQSVKLEWRPSAEPKSPGTGDRRVKQVKG